MTKERRSNRWFSDIPIFISLGSVPLFNKLRLPADRTAVNKLRFFQHRHFKRHFNGSIGESTQHSRRTHEHFTGYLNINHDPPPGTPTSTSPPKGFRFQ